MRREYLWGFKKIGRKERLNQTLLLQYTPLPNSNTTFPNSNTITAEIAPYLFVTKGMMVINEVLNHLYLIIKELRFLWFVRPYFTTLPSHQITYYTNMPWLCSRPSSGRLLPPMIVVYVERNPDQSPTTTRDIRVSVFMRFLQFIQQPNRNLLPLYVHLALSLPFMDTYLALSSNSLICITYWILGFVCLLSGNGGVPQLVAYA